MNKWEIYLFQKKKSNNNNQAIYPRSIRTRNLVISLIKNHRDEERVKVAINYIVCA